MVQNHENPAALDLLRVVGIAQPVDALALGFKLRKALIHFGRQVRVRVLPFRRQAFKFLLRSIVGGFLFLG